MRPRSSPRSRRATLSARARGRRAARCRASVPGGLALALLPEPPGRTACHPVTIISEDRAQPLGLGGPGQARGLMSTIRFAPSRRGRETEARAGHALFQRPRGEGQQSRPSQGDGPAPGGDPPPESGGGVRGGDGLALAPGDHPRAAPMGSAVVAKPCAPLSLGDDGPGDNEGDTKSSDEGPGRTHRPHQRSNGEEL